MVGFAGRLAPVYHLPLVLLLRGLMVVCRGRCVPTARYWGFTEGTQASIPLQAQAACEPRLSLAQSHFQLLPPAPAL